LTRTAVLSDIHGNLPALEAVIADARDQGCGAFLNLGDCLSGPLWPAETADLLIALDWPTIAGNHERQLLAPRAGMRASDAFAADRLSDGHRRWIAALPALLVIDDILACHGFPTSDLDHLLFDVGTGWLAAASDATIAARVGNRRETLILCGHSHRPSERAYAPGRRAANPGSVGLQAFVDHGYYVESDSPAARYAILDGHSLAFRAVEYDHAAAARRAEGAGFDDWALWLATGRV
jgi:diadenosine tetraphosphatase ApaH/serine/threonine PP2A family protein phosphatase